MDNLGAHKVKGVQAQIEAAGARLVYLPRYHNTPGEDPELFANVVDAFQRHLLVAEEPDLLGQVEYLYQHTLGCVGVLKNWMRRALNTALDENARTVTKRHLKEHALAPKKCRHMLAEAQKGESYFADDDAELVLLQRELGMSPTKPVGSVLPQSGDASGIVPTRKQKPFQRKPTRDPVGKDHPCIQN